MEALEKSYEFEEDVVEEDNKDELDEISLGEYSQEPEEYPDYEVDELCICLHDGLYYEAKILRKKILNETASPLPGLEPRQGLHYFVHYKGWKTTWDEFVPPDRLMKHTEENLVTMQNMMAEHNRKTRKAEARKESTHKKHMTDLYMKQPSMELSVPKSLRVQLVDDWEAVTKKNRLVTLPRSPNVVQVLEKFEAYVKEEAPPSLHEPELLIHTIIEGIQIYFEKSCGANLLYMQERAQYAAVRKQYVTGQNVVIGEQKEMSEIYGAEHLLRMLVALPAMMINLEIDHESSDLIRDYVNEMFLWMERERSDLFQLQYESSGGSQPGSQSNTSRASSSRPT